MKKTILMVHNFYKVGGGEHTVFQNECDMLKKNGHKVYTYTRNNYELENSKLKLILLPFSTIWSLKTYREVKKLIRTEAIDIVHCHNTFPLISPSVYYAAFKEHVPVVQTIHNFRFLCPNGIFYRDHKICEECNLKKSFRSALKHKCYRNSFIQTFVLVSMLRIHRYLGTYKRIACIFLSDFNKSRFQNLIGKNRNIFVKGNFAKDPQIQRMYDSEKREKIFVFAGRLDKSKGIDFLLKIWKDLPDDYILHVYGEGPLESEVAENTKQIKNIEYKGFKTQKEIFEDLAGAAALLFPSRLYEGYPMSLIESCSLGVPIVATNLGNQRDLIEKSAAGVLYEEDDFQSFEHALHIVVRDNERYSHNAQVFYESCLSEEQNYKMLEKIYNDIKI